MVRHHLAATIALSICAAGAMGVAAQTTDDDPAAALAKFQDDAAVLSLASDLGSILGSEEFCDLTLDQAGIAAWIKSNVPADRMDFQGQLQMVTMGQQGFNAAMSESARTAHCTAVEQSARHHGLLAAP